MIMYMHDYDIGVRPGVTHRSQVACHIVLIEDHPAAGVGGYAVAGDSIVQTRRVDLVASDYLPITRMAADGRTFTLTVGVPF